MIDRRHSDRKKGTMKPHASSHTKRAIRFTPKKKRKGLPQKFKGRTRKTRADQDSPPQISTRSPIEDSSREKSKGRRNELRVIETLRRPPLALPEWLSRVERASPEEDCAGIDVIITTRDLGKLLLQIKSSERGRRRFLEEHAHRAAEIWVIVIRDKDKPATILRKVLAACKELRRGILQRNASRALTA